MTILLQSFLFFFSSLRQGVAGVTPDLIRGRNDGGEGQWRGQWRQGLEAAGAEPPPYGGTVGDAWRGRANTVRPYGL